MAVKVWHIKGLLKEIKVHHCHTCSPIISLWQVSAFNHNPASESGDAAPITIAVTLQPGSCQDLRMGAMECAFCLPLILNKQSNLFTFKNSF